MNDDPLTRVQRPWGWYDSLDRGECFQVKRIAVKLGEILSLQLHNHRTEHWVIVKGRARVTLGEETTILTEDQSILIPCGEKHGVENTGRGLLEIIEVQVGSYLAEDDIIQFEDRYGRG